MIIRIFCQRGGSCNNMIEKETRLDFKEADILFLYGWKKRNGLTVCRDCLRADQERAENRQRKTA